MPSDTPAGFRGVYRTDDEARAVYSEAAGIGRILPHGVAVPRDADDVAILVGWARTRNLPLIPRGSGSSMGGGAIGGGIVLDLSRLTHLSAVDPMARSVHGGAGVLRGELDRLARLNGLRFPVDPSSGEFCTIGGMAGTNAAGPRSLRFGPMRRWVRALDCVFDDGSRATVRRGAPAPAVPAVQRFMRDADAAVRAAGATPSHPGVLKDSSGYALASYARSGELVDLLVGSEGTLAVFTGVELDLLPAAAARASMLAAFRDLSQAVQAAVDAREHGASACELLDRTFLGIAARAGKPLPVAPDAEAVLVIEVEAADLRAAQAAATALLERARALGASETVLADDVDREAELWSLRHAASPAIAKMDPRLRSMQFIEDAALPPQALAAYVVGVREILHRAGTEGVIFGHAGDAHVHVNPLIDVQRPDWRQRVERILLEVTDLVVRLGGTLTGEHGDGRLRTPLLDRIWSATELSAFALVKRSFDPDSLFNPGVKVPLPGQRAIDLVKYDPALADLPGTARGALRIVERDRAYARLRLELLEDRSSVVQPPPVV